MAQQRLNHTQVGAGLQQMGCEAVAQRMRCDDLVERCLLLSLVADPLDCGGAHGTVERLAGKEIAHWPNGHPVVP